MLKSIQKSLLLQLVSYFSFLSLIIVGLVASTAFIRARDALKESVVERLSVAVSLKDYQLNQWFEAQRQDVLLIAQLPEISSEAELLLRHQAGEDLELESSPDRFRFDGTEAEVKQIQTQLQKLGLYRAVIDGVESEELAEAIAKFQASINLPETGFIEPETLAYLKAYSSLANYFSQLAKIKPNLQRISILTNSGIVVFSTDKALENKYQPLGTTTTYFTADQTNVKPTFYTSSVTEKPAITYATPLLSDNNERIGVVLIDLDLRGIDELIRERTGLGDSGETYLVGRLETRNAFISAQQSQDLKSSPTELSSFGIEQATQGQSGIALYENYLGTPVIGVYRWLDEHNLALLAEMSQKEAFAPARILFREILQIGLASAAVLLVAVYLLSRRITQPVLAIADTAIQVAGGNLNSRAPVLSNNEIGLLARAFNQMTGQLKQANEQLELRIEAATAELTDTLANMASIIDNIADGLLVTDGEGKINRFNPALPKMFGLGEVDLVGQYCQEVLSNEIGDLIQKIMSSPGLVFTTETTLDKGKIFQAVATAVLKETEPQSQNPTCIGSVILIRDITAEKEVDRMKTDFISTVSHELRTPLTSVIGFAKIIKKKLDEAVFPVVNLEDKKLKKAVNQVGTNIDIIISEGERLTTLINDVLDIAKMEAGKIDWKMEPIVIEEIIARAIAATESLFFHKDLTLIKEIEPKLPEAMGDRDRLIQVVINLISNAVKFTEAGSVTVQARQTEGALIVSVIDTGAGIAEVDQPKVFEKFKQVGDTLTDKPKGTGLGLPICREIIEHHQGKIWVTSVVGQGSTFSFSLPLPEVVENSIQTINLESLLQQLRDRDSTADLLPLSINTSKTILVVDDDPNIRELLRQELDAAGYKVQQAENGKAAIASVKLKKPDLIVLDVRMPEISGFDVTAVLKSDPETRQIPIIILSVDDTKGQSDRIGADCYLTKPISTETLLREIHLLLEQGSSKKQVLVIDENVSTAKILTKVLQARGYNVTEAYKGEEVIEKIRKVKPSLVIANSNLSTQYDLKKALRFEKELEDVFLILLETPDPQNESTNLEKTS